MSALFPDATCRIELVESNHPTPTQTAGRDAFHPRP